MRKRNPRNYGGGVPQEAWALDDVVQVSKVTQNFDKHSQVFSKMDGVFIDGLFLEGARWNKMTDSLDEPEPKTPYSPLPVLHMTAEKFKRASDNANKNTAKNMYNCPIYKYKKRTDLY